MPARLLCSTAKKASLLDLNSIGTTSKSTNPSPMYLTIKAANATMTRTFSSYLNLKKSAITTSISAEINPSMTNMKKNLKLTNSLETSIITGQT